MLCCSARVGELPLVSQSELHVGRGDALVGSPSPSAPNSASVCTRPGRAASIALDGRRYEVSRSCVDRLFLEAFRRN
eukprot:2668379-Prymnesium_polylepis.1